MKKARKKTKKDRVQQGVQNDPPGPPAKAITTCSNCSTNSNGHPIQTVKNDGILGADRELDSSDYGLEREPEDYTDGQLGDADNPGPGTFLLGA